MKTFSLAEWHDLTTAQDLMMMAIWAIALLLIIAGAALRRWWPLHLQAIRIPSAITRHFWLWLMPLAMLTRLPGMIDSAWYDETFTGVMASLPLDHFFTALAGDVHPPLYYLAAKLSVFFFGANDIAIRMPALIAGLLLIPAMYRLAWRLTEDKNTARLVAAIVALLPAMIHYSNEARYPSALALMVVLSSIAIIEKRWLLWMVATVALPFFHATGVVYAAALTVIVLCDGYEEWYVLRDFGNAVIVVAISIGAAIALMLKQSGDVANGFWLWQMLPVTHLTESAVMLPTMPAGILAMVPAAMLSALGILALYQLPRHRLLLAAIAGVPFAVFVLGVVWHPVYLPRALMASTLISVISWCILARQRLIYQLLLALALLASLPFAFKTEPVNLKEMLQACKGSDYVATTATNMAIVALWYTPEGSRVLAWAGGNNLNQALPESARIAMGFDFLPPELMSGQICLITQWNHFMEDSERRRIAAIRRAFGPADSRETFKASEFIIYEVSIYNRAVTTYAMPGVIDAR